MIYIILMVLDNCKNKIYTYIYSEIIITGAIFFIVTW